MRRLKIPLVLFGLTLVVGTVAWVFQPRAHAVEVAAEVVAASVQDGRGSAGVQLTGDLHPDSLAEVRALEGPQALTQARARLEVALTQSTGEAQEGPLCVILSAIARRQHDAEAAASYGRRGAELLPTNGSAHHVFAYAITEQMRDGGMLSALKNIGVWRDELRLAIELDGENVDARREEIFFYGFLPGLLGGDPERALGLVTELEGVNLRMGRALRATLLGLMKREEEALELCRTTLAAEPDDAEMHNALGGLLERSDERAEADEAYAAAMGGEPSRSYYYALYQRAQLRTGGSQYRAPGARSGDEPKIWGAEEALEFLDEYLADAPRAELMPSRADAYWRRGVALESLRRADEAPGGLRDCREPCAGPRAGQTGSRAPGQRGDRARRLSDRPNGRVSMMSSTRAAKPSVHTGTVNVTEVPGYRIESSPCGGVKASGLGVEEGVIEAIEVMTTVETLLLPW